MLVSALARSDRNHGSQHMIARTDTKTLMFSRPFGLYQGKATGPTCIEWLKIIARDDGFIFDHDGIGTVMGCEV